MHERIHETSKAQFKCKICPTKFSYPDKNSLLFHNYLCHKEIPFKCSLCDYGVMCKTALAHHVRERHDSQNRSLKNLQRITTATTSSQVKGGHGPCNMGCTKSSSSIVGCQVCSFKGTDNLKRSKSVQISECGYLELHNNPFVLLQRIHLMTL